MSSIRTNNRAAMLLAKIREEDGMSIERLALLARTSASELRACQDHQLILPAVVQLRLARAIATRIPRLATQARQLELQATAAASVESGSIALHLTAPAKWW
jgi:hypothetical protein